MIIDLTHPLTKGDRGVDYQDSHLLDRDGWNARTWQLYSHSNTHMDAPRHFIADGSTIDQAPLEVCMGPAWVIDLGQVEPRQTRGRFLGEQRGFSLRAGRGGGQT